MPFIGAGSYGCVFRPALPCHTILTQNESGARQKKTGRHHHKNTVGKVFTDQAEFERERLVLEAIHRLDPRGEFTVPYLYDCLVDLREADARSCKALVTMMKEGRRSRSRVKNLPQLVLYNGSSTLDALVRRKPPLSWDLFRRVFVLLRPVVVGLGRLAKAGWVHQDIKPAN